MQSNNLCVVLVGDSRAAGWTVDAPQGVQVINRGVNGATTTQVQRLIERAVVPLNPNVVILQVGVNDFWRVGVFDSSEKATIIANAQRNIAESVSTLTGAGAHVILTSIFPLGMPPLSERLWKPSETQAAVKTTNQFLHGLASSTVTIFDTARMLCDSTGRVKPTYLRDYLHLNERGYAALNQALIPLLKEHRVHETL